MKSTGGFCPVRLSLSDLLGSAYVEAAAAARSALTGEPVRALLAAGRQKVDFFPARVQAALRRRLSEVGKHVLAARRVTLPGATSRTFQAATKTAQSPLSGWGYYRLGEDGRLHFLSKSEHYHAPLGHAFEGYRLIEIARRLGVPNATHNNTRGHVTRLVETELVRTAAGLAASDVAGLQRALRSTRPAVLNRVLNLQTGSLACEAALKMMLARFHRPQDDSPPPAYAGRTPVIVVLGDSDGGLSGNYHGTTILAQMLRGMWPTLRDTAERAGMVKVVAVRPNSIEDLEAAFARWDRGRHKVAGFCHELVMMNYAAVVLDKAFVRRAYALCRAHDVPVMCDEIQTCLWSPPLYMFREYGVKPNFVIIGKGFPGGEFAGSRILFDAPLDSLPQFGALVTNGQEEIASVAYLVTMAWAEANAAVTGAIGEQYESRLRDVCGRFGQVAAVNGRRHLAGILFHELPVAKRFAADLVEHGLDISVQTYKAACPPCALTKLPLIADEAAVDMVLSRIEAALKRL